MTGSSTAISADAVLDSLPQPWERLPEESDRAFAAFARYRDLPAHERSIVRAAEGAWGERRGKSGVLATYVKRFEKWSSAHYWTARARQFDDFLARVQVEAEVEARRAMGVQHAKVADALVAKAIEKLAALKVEDMTARDAARFVDVGVKVGRLVRGESIEVPGEDESGREPVQDTILAILSADPEVVKAGARFGAQVLRVKRENEEDA